MFQFPRLPPPDLCVQSGVTTYNRRRVASFGNPRISLLGSSPRLIAAIPRPSSAQSAKASTVRRSRLTYSTVPACTSFSGAHLPDCAVEGTEAGKRRPARHTHVGRVCAWTLNTTIHICKVTHGTPVYASRTQGGTVGTNAKPKEGLGGCQGGRRLLSPGRRSAGGREGRWVREVGFRRF